MKDTARWIVPLDAAAEGAGFGGKATTLARLVRAGFPVPEACLVVPEARDAALVAGGVDARLTALSDALQGLPPDQRARRGAALRDEIAALDLPAGLADALVQLTARGGTWVVRSSAAGEDSASHSFAGQLDSVLGVSDAAAMVAAVRQVWASAWSDRSLAYQVRTGRRLAGGCVVLQRQVEAAWAGVMFSVSPADASALRIEYCAGLADRLVDGRVTPSAASLCRDSGRLLSHEAGDEAVGLGDTDLQSLASLARRIEAALGYPVDVEWVLDRDGRAWIVQARPITAAPAAPSGAMARWSNANIAENFPEPVSPLLYSIVRAGYAAYFRNLGLGFGLARRRIDAMGDALEAVVGVHRGRLYYNLTHIHTLLRLAPGGAWLTRFFNEFTGAREYPEASHPLPTGGRLGQAVEGVRVAASIVRQYLFIQRRVADFERRVDAHCDRLALATLPARSRSELLGALRGFMAIRLRHWNGAALADTAAMVCYGVLGQLLARWLPEAADERRHNRLLVGLPDLASHLPVQKLWALSRRIPDDPVLAALFAGPVERILPALEGDARHAGFRALLASYLEDWGFRNSGELMLCHPSPIEAPQPTLALLKTYLGLTGPSPDARLADQASEREAASRETRDALCRGRRWARLPLLGRAWWFERVLAATQEAIRLRERARMKQARLYVSLRHVVLEAGRRLQAEGRLERPEDVLYLTVDELDALLAGLAMLPEATPAMVALRRRHHARFEGPAPPDSFEWPVGEPYPLAADASAEATPPSNDSRLRGVGACGGRVEGVAAVLADASQGAALDGPHVVVTRQTDPGWAAVFFLASGLVVERGGMLSHGAIIAREFGIPAVVGVPDATRRLRTGLRVSVDGDRGEVVLLG